MFVEREALGDRGDLLGQRGAARIELRREGGGDDRADLAQIVGAQAARGERRRADPQRTSTRSAPTWAASPNEIDSRAGTGVSLWAVTASCAAVPNALTRFIDTFTLRPYGNGAARNYQQ